jgi:hypothetical protein
MFEPRQERERNLCRRKRLQSFNLQLFVHILFFPNIGLLGAELCQRQHKKGCQNALV